jgi:two-component system, NarL family, nitrate/nitrite response regulator NarL
MVPMAKKIKLAVVDDHPVVRRGVVETFSEEADFDVVAEGGSAGDAIRIARDNRPDLMLLDVTLPGGGIEAVSKLRSTRPDMRVLMLSIREDLATVRSALKAGASGYISKGIDGDDLVDCARRVAAGESYVSPELAARLLTVESHADGGASSRSASGGVPLTQREGQIFQLLGEGLSNAEIAEKLDLSENTIKHYITPLLHKLGLRNRTEAAVLARTGTSPRTR